MDKSTIMFILLIIISWINPELIYNLNKFYVGKLVILIIIVFFSSCNIILGLLTILMYFLILDKYRYVIEGMSNEEQIKTENTIGEIKENVKEEGNEEKEVGEKESKKNKIIISTSNINSNGIDIQDIRDSIASKDSNSLPLNRNIFKSSDDVEPFNTG